MAKTTQAKNGDERRFNETLKRMLATPPTPHASKPITSDKPADSKKKAKQIVRTPRK